MHFAAHEYSSCSQTSEEDLDEEDEELSKEEFFDLALLRKVQDHPCLYNNEKRNDKAVENAWEKISKELNTPGNTFSYDSWKPFYYR